MFNVKKSAPTICAMALVISAPVSADTQVVKKPYEVLESVEVSDHHRFGTGETVNGATIMIRDFRQRVVNATLTTRALEPDAAYSIWVAAFNRPAYCAIAYDCKVTDLKNPDVKASVFWGGGLIADSTGYASTTLKINRGRTGRELFGGTMNYGLMNLRRAEVHFVLRYHGPAGYAGPVAQQIGTADEACPVDGCSNVFASIHKIRTP